MAFSPMRHLLVSKSIKGDVVRWHWARLSVKTGSTIATSVDHEAPDHGGYPTLAELLTDVKAKFPDDAIDGIGGDEPEAEGLSW